jgi:adenylate cyclase
MERVQLGYGLPTFEPDDRIRRDDLSILPALAASIGIGLDEGELARLTRACGENARKLGEALETSYTTRVMQSLLASGLSAQQVVDAASRANAMRPMVDGVLLWLFHRHLDNAIFRNVLEHLEAAMAQAGIVGHARTDPAVAFLDLTGYTSLTEERGDAEAAELASNLAALVQESARRYEGKLVKLLGDGAMCHFPRTGSALECALELVGRAPAAGLPPATSESIPGP